MWNFILCTPCQIWNDQVKEGEMGTDVTRTEERRTAYEVLVGKSKEKTPLGRRRRMWEDIIKINLKEIGWGGGGEDWIHLNENRDQ
jgi:hypothetical protein